MTSTVTETGATVVPKKLRDRLRITEGALLDWRVDGNELRVVRKSKDQSGKFVEALRKLGSVPAPPRDKRPVKLET